MRPRRRRQPDRGRDTGRLVLDPALPLPGGLSACFAGIVSHARATARGSRADPPRGVHEFRKAVRRARSLVRFTATLPGAGDLDQLDERFRRAMGSTSALRDAAVGLSTLARHGRVAGAREVEAVLVPLLDAARREASDPDRVERTLLASSRLLAGAPARFDAARPGRLRSRDLCAAVGEAYRRARRARRRAMKAEAFEAIHAFRRRTKELRYQLELLASADGKRTRRKLDELVRLADALGRLSDAIALRELASRRGGAAGERFAREVGERVLRQFRRVAARCTATFADAPSRFARRLLA